jgi:hypothetical protein
MVVLKVSLYHIMQQVMPSCRDIAAGYLEFSMMPWFIK